MNNLDINRGSTLFFLVGNFMTTRSIPSPKQEERRQSRSHVQQLLSEQKKLVQFSINQK